MTQELQPVELTVVDTNTAEWVGFPIPERSQAAAKSVPPTCGRRLRREPRAAAVGRYLPVTQGQSGR
jgi:hypothetical protein